MGAPSERINNVVGTNPKDTVSLHREKLLLGEGPDEVEFLKALASKLEIDGLQIEHYGGKDNLGNYLITLPKIPGYSLLSTIGITRDADDSFSASYESVSNMVRRIGLEVPST
ncbi:MAG TPA: DUF3226 domain-containing protein, partial [Blastocatellia bacterium]|nr:DUF3226 domain-containing protein [Blastocatellia bacterium]